jgi:hypothetical protein
MALLGDYEVWRNTFVSGGGYLVLFGKEELPVLRLTDPGYEGRDETRYGLLRCNCGSYYRGRFNPEMGMSFLCACGLAVDVPKVGASSIYDSESGEPPKMKESLERESGGSSGNEK